MRSQFKGRFTYEPISNGSATKGKTMLATLEQLGVLPSFSRPRVSDDNPFVELVFRRMKYRPSYPGGRFQDITDARLWVEGFVRWYNDDHQHSGIRFVTPSQRHDGREHNILIQRHQLYIKARQRAPQRWSGATRNWTPAQRVRSHTPRLKSGALSAQICPQAASFDGKKSDNFLDTHHHRPLLEGRVLFFTSGKAGGRGQKLVYSFLISLIYHSRQLP